METKYLLLLPTQYVNTVLQLTYTHLRGAHLGMEKTREQIGNRFHWPGVKCIVEDYCRTCLECPITALRTHYRNPLIHLPIIGVPFEWVAMDLVGPLVKTARGHQYIRVLMFYDTRYPEAFPLCPAAAKGIARELF